MQTVPDFLQGRNDMGIRNIEQFRAHAFPSSLVIPQPIYANTEGLMKEDDDDLKTPTVEELSFPGGQRGAGAAHYQQPEDNSSSSSATSSIGSCSSGYGSQPAIAAKQGDERRPLTGEPTWTKVIPFELTHN